MRALALVKGKPADTVPEAVTRGFDVLAMNLYDPKVETCYLTLEGEVFALMRWFCERPSLVDGYGFPSGTLLFYGDPAFVSPRSIPKMVTWRYYV